MKRSFFQYVSLNVLGALGLSGYILADTLFVAHRLGTDGLAALNLAISVFGLINGLGLMLGIGGATRYAICRTQGDGVRADRAFSRALACGGGLYLLDEPFTGLDPDTKQQAARMINKYTAGKLLLFSTHSQEDAALLGAEILRLDENGGLCSPGI